MKVDINAVIQWVNGTIPVKNGGFSGTPSNAKVDPLSPQVPSTGRAPPPTPPGEADGRVVEVR